MTTLTYLLNINFSTLLEFMRIKELMEMCLVLSHLICAMHATLSSNNVVGLSLIERSLHDSWMC